jgi:hypothetical protein
MITTSLLRFPHPTQPPTLSTQRGKNKMEAKDILKQLAEVINENHRLKEKVETYERTIERVADYFSKFESDLVPVLTNCKSVKGDQPKTKVRVMADRKVTSQIVAKTGYLIERGYEVSLKQMREIATSIDPKTQRSEANVRYLWSKVKKSSKKYKFKGRGKNRVLYKDVQKN